VTSVQAVRSTYEECRRVVQILRNMHVAFQQKDIFLHPDYRKELTERLGIDKPTVPQVSGLCVCYKILYGCFYCIHHCVVIMWSFICLLGVYKRTPHWSKSIDISLMRECIMDLVILCVGWQDSYSNE